MLICRLFSKLWMGKCRVEKSVFWFEETLIPTSVWRISITQREPSAGQTGPGPVMVPEHNRQKPRIISNW